MNISATGSTPDRSEQVKADRRRQTQDDQARQTAEQDSARRQESASRDSSGGVDVAA